MGKQSHTTKQIPLMKRSLVLAFAALICLSLFMPGTVFGSECNQINQLQSLDTAHLTPYLTEAGRARLKGDSPIEPRDVYQRVLSLQAQLKRIGIHFDEAPSLMNPDTVLPRHNYVLAYDIFILQQVWYQHHHNVAQVPPDIKYPSNIKPAEVFQWIDASLLFVQCVFSLPKESIKDKQTLNNAWQHITPAHVYYLLEQTIKSIAAQIPHSMLQQFQLMRVNQIYYGLQNYLMLRSTESVVNWSAYSPSTEASIDNTIKTALSTLQVLDTHLENRSVFVSLKLRDSSKLEQGVALIFALSQIYGELQTLGYRSKTPLYMPPALPLAGQSYLTVNIDERVEKIAHLASRLIQREQNND